MNAVSLDKLLILMFGWLLASFVNWAIYHWAYQSRPIGPWSPAPPGFPPRSWDHFLPIVGWWRMRPELSQYGRSFWIRPFLIDVLFPLCILGLYLHEWSGAMVPACGPAKLPPGTVPVQFAAHALLLTLLAIATFIDLDERTIPDSITIPGSLLACAGAAIWPNWHVHYCEVRPAGMFLTSLHPASPEPWDNGWSATRGLWLAWLCFSLWCFALADRRWIMRRGWKKAIQYFIAGLVRYQGWKTLLAIWIVGSLALVVAHRLLPLQNWKSLFSSVIGLALGAMVVWSVRIVAGAALRVQALGFGDVTLMAMVGAFLGWQTAWLAFFVSPVMAMGLVLVIYALTRDAATPFGPYLCAGTLTVLLLWRILVCDWALPRLFSLGSWLVYVLLAFLMVMGVLLWCWRIVKENWLLRHRRKGEARWSR